MNLTLTQKVTRFSSKFFENLRGRSGGVYMGIIVAALIAFELFNFSTTDFALRGIFGSQASAGVNWSTILALAYCGMDFADLLRALNAIEGDFKLRFMTSHPKDLSDELIEEIAASRALCPHLHLPVLKRPALEQARPRPRRSDRTGSGRVPLAA